MATSTAGSSCSTSLVSCVASGARLQGHAGRNCLNAPAQACQAAQHTLGSYWVALLCAHSASILEGLAKARHPAAKAAAQAPAKQEVAKKRSCNAGKPMCMRASEGEDASLHKEASILASLRDGPAKKQRPAEGPRAALAAHSCLQAAQRGGARAEPCAAHAPQIHCGFLIAPLP